jgi:uncharacterized protein
MNIDITRLRNKIDSILDIDFTYSFSEEELKNTDIRKLDNVSIKGYIRRNSLDEYELNINIVGTMVLECAITLKDVNYDFNIEIDDNLDRLLEENDKKIQNTIDIFPIIWENILLEVPMKVVSEDASLEKTEGDGWKLITEDENL